MNLDTPYDAILHAQNLSIRVTVRVRVRVTPYDAILPTTRTLIWPTNCPEYSASLLMMTKRFTPHLAIEI